MPRVNLGKQKPDKLKLLLNGYVCSLQLSRVEVGRIIGTCDDTARERLKHPEDLTIRQLLALGKEMGVPIEEFRSAIQY